MSADSAKSIDNYEIAEILHQSEAGVVYRAVEKSTNNKVLIKKYYPTLEWSDEVLSDFFNLVSYLRFIEHEYLLPILDVGKHGNLPYIVFADAHSLLANHQPREAGYEETLDFLRHTAEALDFLHKQEIVHGTLSPDNMALDADGFPQLFDFGLSGVFKKLLLENTDEGFENLSISSLQCTSPEQIQGRTPTRASDQYAFGVIGFFFLFGEYPIHASSTPEIAAGHLRPGILRTVQLSQSHLRDLLQIIQKCMQLAPNARFESFAQLSTALERMLTGKRVRFSFSKRFAIVGAHNRQLQTRMPYWIGIALLVILGGIYYFSIRDFSASPPAATLVASPETSSSPQPPPPTLVTNSAGIESATPAVEPSTDEPASIEVAYKPAIERQTPLTPSMVIQADNLTDLLEISRLGYGKPEEIAVSSDGVNFAFASSAGVYIFNQTQAVGWIDPQGWTTSVQFSPDNSILAVGVAKGDIQLWDWRKDVKIATLSAHTDRITRIIFSQGELMYSASADQNVIVWNWKTQRQILSIPAHARPVNDIAVTSDGRTLFSCSDDGLIRVWDLASGRKLYELSSVDEVFSGNIRALDLSSDDVYLAAGGDVGYLYQWELVTTSAATSLIPQLRTDKVPVKSRIWSLQYIRDDQDLLVGTDEGKYSIYVAARQEYEGISLSFQLPQPSSNLVDVFGASFDFASQAVFGRDSILTINWDGTVMNQQSQVVSPMFDNLDRLDFSPDGMVLAAGGGRGSTHVWDLKTNLPLYKNMYFMPHGDPIAPDGSAIVIIVPQTIVTEAGNAVTEGAYQIKTLTGSQTAHDLSSAIPNATVGYARDGSVFVAASYNESRTWDFDSGYETFSKHDKYLGCALTTSANDGESLQVTAVSGTLPVLDPRAEIICPRSQRTEGSLSTLSNNLDLLVYMNQNGLLEGFDIAQNQTIWQYRPESGRASVLSLAASPDGSLVAVGTATGDLIFIDSQTGRFITEITGNYGRLQAIEFSDDGYQIATAGSDGVVRTFGIVGNQ